MKRFSLLAPSVFGSVLLCTMGASAATITQFSASYNTSAFTHTGLTASYSGSNAVITNTSLSCAVAIGCSGTAMQFEIVGTGLDPTQQISISLDGNLSGTAGGSGNVVLYNNANLRAVFPFTFAAGDFNTQIVTTTLPFLGNFDVLGGLNLTLTTAQTLTLPSSFSITVGAPSPSATPEPGSMALLGTGLSGLFLVIRRLRA